MFGGGNEDRWGGGRGNVERSGGGKTRDCLRRTRGSLERPLRSRSYPAYRQKRHSFTCLRRITCNLSSHPRGNDLRKPPNRTKE